MDKVVLYDLFESIYSESSELRKDNVIGFSREDRAVNAYVFGCGELNISLIAGCHGDEPVGPLLLNKLVNYLCSCDDDHWMLRLYTWYIIPDANPDAHRKNLSWWSNASDYCDFWKYLTMVTREKLGDDVEFGFPVKVGAEGIRRENTVIADWWLSQDVSFDLHASLHGMGFAAGPWFLLGDNWVEESSLLRDKCCSAVKSMGYRPHDVERHGEKGFYRIGKGFSTCPSSQGIRDFFTAVGDFETAEKCFANSMEFMRMINSKCLTLVTEMPLFLLPDVGIEIGPPDKASEAWKLRMNEWLSRDDYRSVMSEVNDHGLRPMSIKDQMSLQWYYICASLMLLEDRSTL